MRCVREYARNLSYADFKQTCLENKISRVESLCSHTTAFPWTTWSTAVDKLRSRVKGHVVQVHSGVRNPKRISCSRNNLSSISDETSRQ